MGRKFWLIVGALGMLLALRFGWHFASEVFGLG